MSANRDKDQKIAFVYSNLYKIYRDEKKKANLSEKSPILKSNDAAKEPIQIRTYQPAEFIEKRTETIQLKKDTQKAAHPKSQFKPHQNLAVHNLKTNLQSLSEIHQRLNFMLKELEDLTKED